MPNIGIQQSGTGGGGGGVTGTGTPPQLAQWSGASTLIGVNRVIQHTVAELQALATGNSLVAGQIYQITNAYSSTAVINIKAFSTSVLEDYGFGTFQNQYMAASVNCFMWYDLTGNKVWAVFEPVHSNYCRNGSQGSPVDEFPFDGNHFSGSYNGNTIINTELGGVANFYMSASSFTRNTITNAVQISIDDPSEMVGCIVNSNAALTIPNANLDYCTIGANKTLDLTNIASGYAATGKVYEGSTSTFEITSGDSANVNPDGSNIINMADFAFAGILKCDDDTNHLKSFTNFPTDHEWKVQPTSSKTIIVDDVSGGGVDIQLYVSASTLNVDANNGDWVSFQANPNGTGTQSIIQRIRS